MLYLSDLSLAFRTIFATARKENTGDDLIYLFLIICFVNLLKNPLITLTTRLYTYLPSGCRIETTTKAAGTDIPHMTAWIKTDIHPTFIKKCEHI